MIGQNFAHYHILEKIGEGGMGVIYKAEDTSLQRPVALKFLAANLASTEVERQRFVQEARAAAALDHPNICPVYEVGADEDRLYIAMAYVAGKTLREVMADGPTPINIANRIIAQIAAGLAAAHSRGIVHRDIKPANIIVGADDHVRIMDFGLAKLGTGSNLTQTGSTLGTLSYMAPEQMQGSDVDSAADVWALGVVYYELLTGQRPFTGDHDVAVMYAVLNERPPSLRSLRSDVSPAIEQLIGRMLERDRTKRIRNAGDFLNELNAIVQASSQPSKTIAAVAAQRSEKSIVVLPFANHSADPESEYFSDGLTEEIITDLSKVHALRVISRTTAMRLKGTSQSLPAIAKDLDVEYALEGGVRKAGNNLRITAQLIDAKRDAPVWSDKFSGTLDEVFEIQEQVSRGIVDALRIHLTTSEQQQLGDHPVTNGLAYDTYLRARRDILSFSKERLDRAHADLTRALAIVGDDILLYRGLGMAEWQYVNAGLSSDLSHLDRAEDYAGKIISLDPRSPHGPALMGYIAVQRGDILGWIRGMQNAVAIDPNDSDMLVWLSLGWICSGHSDDARPLLARLEKRDPHFDFLHFALGSIEFFDARFEDALQLYRYAWELTPDMVGWPLMVAQTLGCMGNPTAASETIRKGFPDPHSHPMATLGHILCHALNGESDAANELITEDFKTKMWNDLQYSHLMAQSYALMGNIDEGMRWLERAVERGYQQYPFLSERDPLLAGLRSSPRFAALMERTRHAWMTFKSRL